MIALDMIYRGMMVGIGALLISLGLTCATRWMAMRRGYVDKPRDFRWHQQPTATLGGIAIFGTLLVASFGLPPAWLQDLHYLIWIGAGLFLVGLVDDIWTVRPIGKLLVQVAAGLVVVALGWQYVISPWDWVNALLTVFWVVGITNAFNLLDNMDGLAAGIALIASLTLAAIAAVSGLGAVWILACCLAGAFLGFLWFNVKPASIFMGDSGSLFMGLMMAILPLAVIRELEAPHHYLAAIPVFTLFIPIFDTTFVTCLRILSGRSVAKGGRDHTSHLLVGLGLSERVTVTVLMAANGCAGGIVLLLLLGFGVLANLASLLLAIVAVLLGIYLGREWLLWHRDGHEIGLPRMRAFERYFRGNVRRPVWESLLLWGCAIMAFLWTEAALLQGAGWDFAENIRFIMPPVVCAQWGAFLLVGRGAVFNRGGMRSWLQAVVLGFIVSLGAVAAQRILTLDTCLFLTLNSVFLAVFTVLLGHYLAALTRHPLKIAASQGTRSPGMQESSYGMSA